MLHLFQARTARTAGIVAILCVALWWFFSGTHYGRITGTHLVAGLMAPPSLHLTCIHSTNELVAAKFSSPPTMNGAGVQALEEYWHYAFMRQCLYNTGRSFLGKKIPAPQMVTGDDGVVRYENPLAGIRLILPQDSALVTSNTLDVTYDYRRYESTFLIGTSSMQLLLYTEYDHVSDFTTLANNLHTLLPDHSALEHVQQQETSTGIPYARGSTTLNECMYGFYTPHAQIVLFSGPCAIDSTLFEIVNSIGYVQTIPSLH